MRALNTRLEQARGIRLAVRLGIHTGQVVVGEMGGGERHEQLALGETPNLAARLQGLAALDTVVISAATLGLVQGYVEYQELGVHTLKGVTAPVTVYRILRPSVAQSRLDVASARGLTPFVGRESELALLLERWAQVKEGTGHVVLVNGEAGIGKSRLVQVLKDNAAAETHTRLECRCSPYHQNSALYPLIDLLHRALSWQEHEAPADRLEKLEHALRQYRLALDETVPLLAALLSLPLPEGRYPQLILTPQRQKQQTLEVILTLVLELTERQPVLFIVEDLHWVDPSTLEFLGLLIDQGPTVRLLTLLTYRPTFQPPWLGRAHITPFTLTRLPAAQVESMVARLTYGKPLPTEVLHHVVTKTDGVPLFVEELTKMLLESGLLTEADDRYGLAGHLPTLAIPTTLHDSLMARLDRLAAVKVVAQLGATLGRQFSYSLLQAVSPWTS
jgi:predicted ATPase